MAKRKGTVLIGTPSQLADEPEPLKPRDSATGDEPSEPETEPESPEDEDEDEPEPEGEPESPEPSVPEDEPEDEPEPEDEDEPAPRGGRGATWTGPLGRDAVAPPAPVGEIKIIQPRVIEKEGTGDFDAPESGRLSSEGSGRITIPRPSDYRPSSQLPKRNTTTFIELNAVAERLSVVTAEKVPIGRQIALSSAAGLLLVLLVIGVLVGGTLRWVILGGVFLVVTGLLAVGAARVLPRLAQRYGTVELPGGIRIWLAGSITLLAATAAGLTWGLSEATTTLAGAAFPELRPDIPEEEEPPPPEPVERADAHLKTGERHRARPGLLYVPTGFTSEDGQFDLIIHFHGNPELVSQSVVEADINALIHITNLGLRSGPYKQWSMVPDAFDRLLSEAEKAAVAMGLRDAKVRRIALSCWSAGYGAMLHILDKDRHRDRVDALLVTDGMHGGYRTEAEREIHPMSLGAFVAFGKRAVAGDKLFVLTHSRIQTAGYASAKKSADFLLDELGVERTETDVSPPEVDFDVAVKAFPANGRNWLKGLSSAQKGELYVYGYAGNESEDHIAHLAQMSVTVLPPLKKRWATPPSP